MGQPFFAGIFTFHDLCGILFIGCEKERNMVFSSLIFIFGYLSVTLLLYYISPIKWRNFILFLVSLIFYGWGEPRYIFLMLLSTCSAYGFGFGIECFRERNRRLAKLFLALSVTVNLSFLLFFKYYNFFAENIGFSSIQSITLPVGISFYTFQIISYSVDLYRGAVPLAKRFVPFGTYVSLFPQLIAGPIVRYKDVCDQLEKRKETISMFASGVHRFIIGLAKKLILGDAAALAAELLETSAEFAPTVVGAWMVLLFYSFHIYFDFSGYSDMAIGLGKMFGFTFPENFCYPYTAKSVTDFWRRWHITLSTWFKEYVYIPLGGNRKGKGRSFLNLAVVWFLTGFWHGADWSYILWGVYFWLFLVLEKAFLSKLLDHSFILGRLYALVVIGFGWIIFFHTDLRELLLCAKHLVGIGAALVDRAVLYDLLRLLPFVLLCAIGCTPLPKKLFLRLKERFSFVEIISPFVSLLLLLVCVAYMVDNSFSPFLYYIF